MVTKFGIWEIEKDFGIIGRLRQGEDYNIAKETLWQTTDFKGQVVYDWLIHLTEKTWVTKEIYDDLVIAYVFAIDYFKKQKPNNAKPASISQSIYVGQQLVEMAQKSEDTDEWGLDFSSEKAFKVLEAAFEEHTKIKLLD